jgi:hypothetical protein
LTGGDVKDCLSDIDINKVVGHITLTPADAFCAEKRKSDDTVRQLATHLKGKSGLLIIHTRHHWLAAQLQQRVFTVYDSAISPPVQRDVYKLALEMGWNPPTFAACPQQHYGTNECGLFAARASWERETSSTPAPASPTSGAPESASGAKKAFDDLFNF